MPLLQNPQPPYQATDVFSIYLDNLIRSNLCFNNKFRHANG